MIMDAQPIQDRANNLNSQKSNPDPQINSKHAKRNQRYFALNAPANRPVTAAQS